MWVMPVNPTGHASLDTPGEASSYMECLRVYISKMRY